MAKDTFYFSHDYNARNDIKIKKLIAKHGYLGYGIFWAIIEELYNNANALPLDYECIAYDMRTSENVIDSIINEFDLFVLENGYFGSASVERRLEQRNEKSVKAKESANKRWEKIKNNANALQTHSEGNAIKESKVKETKENEIKVNRNDLIFNELSMSESWLERVSMQSDKKFNIQEVKEFLKKYNDMINVQFEVKNNKNDYCSHFIHWLNKQEKKNNSRVLPKEIFPG